MVWSHMREWVKSVAYGAISLGHLEFLLTRRGVGHILNIHRVHPDPSPFWPPIQPDQLDWLISRLKRLGSFVDVRELSAAPVSASDRIFALSFDDGYADFAEYGLPVLESHEVPSNLNVVAESVLTGRPIWSTRLYDALAQVEDGALDEIGGGLVDAWGLLRRGSREHAGFAISNHLRGLQVGERDAVIERIEGMGGPNSDPIRALTVQEVTSLPESVHVGAHGGTHEPMTHASLTEFENDFEICRDLFAGSLQLPLVTYAFPLGGYQTGHLDFLLASGVEQILLVDEKTTKGGGPVLTRLTVGGTFRGQFLAKSVGITSRLTDV